MNAALTAQLTAVALQAQDILGENALYNGAVIKFVFGPPTFMQEQMEGGGYRGRTTLTAAATRDQFSTPPINRQTVVRTALTPQVTYRIESIGFHDPIHYVFHLSKVGE